MSFSYRLPFFQQISGLHPQGDHGARSVLAAVQGSDSVKLIVMVQQSRFTLHLLRTLLTTSQM